MLASALRVTGTQESEWTIAKQAAEERFQTGVKEVSEGKMESFPKLLYTRVFFEDGWGNYAKKKGTLNDLLGLPEGSLDQFTKVAIARQISGGSP